MVKLRHEQAMSLGTKWRLHILAGCFEVRQGRASVWVTG